MRAASLALSAISGISEKCDVQRHEEAIERRGVAGFAGSDHLLEGDRVVAIERRDKGAAQCGDVAEATEFTAKIARQRADIGALAAFRLETAWSASGVSEQRQTVDDDLARGQLTVSPSRARS